MNLNSEVCIVPTFKFCLSNYIYFSFFKVIYQLLFPYKSVKQNILDMEKNNKYSQSKQKKCPTFKNNKCDLFKTV